MGQFARTILAGVIAAAIWPAAAPASRPASRSAAAAPGAAAAAALHAATAPEAAANLKFPAAPPGAYVTAEGWFAEQPPKFPRPILPAEIARAFIIPIHEDITGKTASAVARKMNRSRAGGAQIIIFDLKTYGGEEGAMAEIAQQILDNKDVYTVAYVDPNAASAGAVIALACTEIVVSPTAKIGAAMPIMIGDEGGKPVLVPIPPKERMKFESWDKSGIRMIAQSRGHSEILCQGMITLEIEVWLIRNRKTGELRPVDAADERGKVHKSPATTQPGAIEVVRDTDWEYVATIDGPTTLVTLTSNEALRVGLSHLMLPKMADLEKHYNIVTAPEVLADTWSETLVDILTSPAVAGILMFLGVFLAYMEINAPGHFVPGILAAVCFALYFGSRYLIGLSDWWQIALFMVGLVLIIVELLTFHTMGLLLVAGVVCCIVGLLGVLVPHLPGTLPIPRTAMDWSFFKSGVLALGIGFIAAVIAAMLFAQYLPRLPVAGKLVLKPFLVASAPPVSGAAAITEINVGDLGVAETLCRPVGKVRFGERLVNATSTGDILQPGDRVKVLKRDENRIVVEKA